MQVVYNGLWYGLLIYFPLYNSIRIFVQKIYNFPHLNSFRIQVYTKAEEHRKDPPPIGAYIKWKIAENHLLLFHRTFPVFNHILFSNIRVTNTK